MIYKCSEKFLAEMAAERGHTLEEAMACIVNRDGNTITVDTDSPAYPRDRNPSRDEQSAVWKRVEAGAEGMKRDCCSPPTK